MSVLDRVNSPKDLKKLNDKELEVLCDDIRELLITLVLTDDDQNLTGCWRTQRIVNLILSFVRHNPDLPEN